MPYRYPQPPITAAPFLPPFPEEKGEPPPWWPNDKQRVLAFRPPARFADGHDGQWHTR